MIFNEEMNYSGTNPVSYPDHSNWKQQAFSNPNAINDGIGPYDNKMRNWNGDYGAGNTTKMQHESMAPSPFYGQTQFWNEQSSPFHPSQQLELHEPKYMGGHNSYNIGNVPIGGGNDNPQHWGRSEINQTTPWDVNAIDKQQRYRKWDQQDNGNFVGMMQQPNSGFNERIMANGMSQQMNRNVGGMPIMGQRIGNNAQLWMDNVGRFGEHSGGNRGSSANPGSAMFMTPPPPLGMMTNHRQLIGPPPPLPSIHPASSMQQSFAITSFSVPSNQVQQSTMGMGAMQINEDAMWQDPNGDLRKWQRDTGTSIWGDPAKQNCPIQRWQHFTADEVVATSNTKALKESDQENGWGELPPLNGRTSSNYHGSTVNQTDGNGTSRPGPNNSSNNNGSSGWTAPDQSSSITNGSSNWSDQPQQQFSQQSQTQMALSSMNNGANNYVIPNISSSTNVFQVPASEMNNGSSTPVNASIPMTTSVTTSLSTLPSTTTSGPSIDEQRQNLKVSLAEELSSIASGLGGIRQGGNDVGSLW